MGAILVSPRRLKSLENEVEDLKYALEVTESELHESEMLLGCADRALIAMWGCVPKEKRRGLMETDKYIEEMFWHDGDM